MTENSRSLVRHSATTVTETDMRQFEGVLLEPDVHHLFPKGSDIAGCGIHKSEVPRCNPRDIYPQDLMKPCSVCGAKRCPVCAARYWELWR